MNHTALLEIIFGVIFGFLALDAFFVLRSVREAVKTFLTMQGQILKAQLETATVQNETFAKLSSTVVTACSQLTAHHVETLQSLTLTHESTMDAVRETHGASAEALRAAAISSADSTAELRRATEKISTLVSDSNLFEIRQHLAALRKFFIGKNE